MKAFAGLRKFQAGTNFSAWLFRIAHNNYANQCRASARQRERCPKICPTRNAVHSIRRPAPKHCKAWDTRSIVCPRSCAALLLCVEEGLSFRQIAEVLDLTEETARWRVFKARQKLLSLLASRQEQERS